MDLSLVDLIILSLATWRLAFMLVRESGPFDIIARARTRSTLGGLLDCVACVSLWSGIILWLLYLTPLKPVVYIPAISAGGLMLASWTGVEFER